MAPKTTANVAGSKYVSKAALSQILQSIRDEPTILDAGLSRHAIKRRRDSDINVRTPHGQVLQEMTLVDSAGQNVKIETLVLSMSHIFALTEC